MADPTERVRRYLLDERRPLLEAVVAAAERTASGWEGGATTDRRAIVDRLTDELESRGLSEQFPAVIEEAVDVAGFELPATPVPGPPYVVVTSTGPVLRATVSGGRLVVSIRVFEVTREPVRYRRRHDDPEAIVDVSLIDG